MSSGTQILFVAYFFPPTGGAGVQRSLSFVRHLPAHGFAPVVVAGPLREEERWEPRDASLQRALPPGVPVLRPSSPPPRVGKLQSRSNRLFETRTAYQRWWIEEVVAHGRAAARERDLGAIYATVSPFESLTAALRLKRELGLPLVVDLRDPWALDEVFVYGSRIAHRRALRRMERELGAAERVIMNTPEAEQAARRAFARSIPPERFVCIPNGFEAADFEGLATRPADGRFRIVHTGYLHAQLGIRHEQTRHLRRLLGGQIGSLDLVARSHVPLLSALALLRRDERVVYDTLDVELVGSLSPADRRLIDESVVRERVRAHGYADHAAAVRWQVSADLLYLPMHGIGPGARARIVPAKTYEYLASGRPILACVPPGDARDLVRRFDAGRVVEPGDAPAIAGAIAAFARDAPVPRRALDAGLMEFERGALAERLAGTLRAAVNASGLSPG